MVVVFCTDIHSEILNYVYVNRELLGTTSAAPNSSEHHSGALVLVYELTLTHH